jgi:hypothetical protein
MRQVPQREIFMHHPLRVTAALALLLGLGGMAGICLAQEP